MTKFYYNNFFGVDFSRAKTKIKRIGTTRIFIVIGIIVYLSLLIYSYKEVLSPEYSYRGYVVYDKKYYYSIFVFLFSVFPSLWMPAKINRPSQLLYWLLYILTYIPIFWVVYYSVEMKASSLIWLHSTLFISFGIIYIFYYLPHLSIPRLHLTWNQYGLCVGLIAFALLAYVVSTFGFRLRLLSFYEVYTVRSELKQTLASASLAAYAIPWLGNVIHPLLMSLGITKRRPFLFIVGVIGQLYIYSITGYKSIILSIALFFAILIALWRGGRYLGLLTAWGTVGLVGMAILASFVTNISLIPYLSVGRLIITPGMLTGYYYDFFSQYNNIYMSDGVLSFLSEYPYDLPPDQMIGAVYRGDASIHANANMWADSFANFGLTGMLVFAVILGVILWVFDSLARNRNRKVAVLMLGLPAINLSNTALETSMLTHGIALVIILMYLMPPESTTRRWSGERVEETA